MLSASCELASLETSRQGCQWRLQALLLSASLHLLHLTRCFPCPLALRSGTDNELPFECPMDFLFPVGQLEVLKVQYRHAGFLEHPQVSEHTPAV